MNSGIGKKAEQSEIKFQMYSDEILILNYGLLFINKVWALILESHNMFADLRKDDNKTCDDALNFF